MKKIKRMMAIAIAICLSLTTIGAFSVFAENTPGDPSITINPANTDINTDKITIDYTWYQILEASIGKDPVVNTSGATTTEGQAAYFVTTSDRAAQLVSTNLFEVTKVDGENKWFVALKSSSTTADQIVAAFSADTFDKSKFPTGSFDKTASEANAQSGNLAAGYYYIESSLGSKIALQTLSPVIINEKNDYTTDNKTIPEIDKNSEIGQDITYTLTVNVPITANKEIVLTDTMSEGLTFKEVKSQSPISGTVSSVANADNNATKFTITYTEEQVKALVAGKTDPQVITVEVTVTVNNAAAIDTDIPNTLDLKYGNVYEAVPVTVNTQTTKFEFDKVDGSDKTTKLAGAEFKLTRINDKNAEAIKLVEVVSGKTYRIATADESATAVNKITTNGNTVTINGLDKDLTYYLVETKAPTGYNELDAPVEVKATGDTTKLFVKKDVENLKGGTLPSTGGMGTTIFYIIGVILLAGAAIVLVTRRRMNAE